MKITVYSLSVVESRMLFGCADINHIVSRDWLHMYALTLKRFQVAIRKERRHEHVSTRPEAFL